METEKELKGKDWEIYLKTTSHACMDIKYFKNKRKNRNIYIVEKKNVLTGILTREGKVDEDGEPPR